MSRGVSLPGGMRILSYGKAQTSSAQTNLAAVVPYMFWLMFRNIASDGFVFVDPAHPGVVSKPGCVLASPTWDDSNANVLQDYVYNWTPMP